MLTYQYQCPNNGEVLEVRHRMSERIETWGELCARLERALGSTPASAPVERVISGGLMASVNGGTARSTEMNLPISGGCCGHPSSCRHHG